MNQEPARLASLLLGWGLFIRDLFRGLLLVTSIWVIKGSRMEEAGSKILVVNYRD